MIRRHPLVIGVALVLAGCGVPATAPGTSPTSGPTGTVSAPTPSVSASATGSSTSPTPVPPTSPAASPSTPAPDSCVRLAGSLSTAEQVGQLLMVGVSSTGISSGVRATLRRTHAGSVVLLGNTTAGVDAVRQVARSAASAADAPGRTTTLVAADQEGGQVQRLRGAGFDRVPSADSQAEDSDARLRSDAKRWGEQLAEARISANLAPVADVVPRDLERVNQPIGVLRRGYGPDPDVVADKVTAFAGGMAEAGLATAVKHFPGLGRVRGNTDFTSRVVDATTTRDDEDLAGFRAAVRDDVDMVMVSSATYSRIDDENRAAFSAVVIKGMIRGDLGFDGVVISDDLSAEAMRDLSPGERALRFLRAGGDLAIVGDPTQAEAMASAVRREAEDDPAVAALVTTSAARVLTMKGRHGLASCS